VSRLRRPRPDPEAFDDEKHVHSVELPRFFLARYPVTVAQWRVYFEAVHPRSGKPSPWTRLRLPRPDGKPWRPPDPRSLQGSPTAPATCVSWYDALDYGRWLTVRLRDIARVEEQDRFADRRVPAVLAEVLLRGDEASQGRPWVITLPSEAEWERGARGRDGRTYPWGKKSVPNLANASETGIEATSPVGCFPGGGGPVERSRCQRPGRIEEMSGNVLEWTRSLWRREVVWKGYRYPYKPDYRGVERERLSAGDEVPRVVRGGAFYDDFVYLRSANRFGDAPSPRLVGLGFRVVVSPFALDPLISDPSDL